jgi:hypothetical protein
LFYDNSFLLSFFLKKLLQHSVFLIQGLYEINFLFKVEFISLSTNNGIRIHRGTDFFFYFFIVVIAFDGISNYFRSGSIRVYPYPYFLIGCLDTFLKVKAFHLVRLFWRADWNFWVLQFYFFWFLASFQGVDGVIESLKVKVFYLFHV